MQEVASEASKAPGRIPQTIECELTNDLVNSAIPGDVVVVSGIVKLMVDENSMSSTLESENVIITLLSILIRWDTESIGSIIITSVY